MHVCLSSNSLPCATHTGDPWVLHPGTAQHIHPVSHDDPQWLAYRQYDVRRYVQLLLGRQCRSHQIRKFLWHCSGEWWQHHVPPVLVSDCCKALCLPLASERSACNGILLIASSACPRLMESGGMLSCRTISASEMHGFKDVCHWRRAIFNITPSGWYLGLQLLHVAQCFYEAPKSIERLQPYLYHLGPLKNWVNRSPVTSLLHASGLSERAILLYIWAVLRVRNCPQLRVQVAFWGCLSRGKAG